MRMIVSLSKHFTESASIYCSQPPSGRRDLAIRRTRTCLAEPRLLALIALIARGSTQYVLCSYTLGIVTVLSWLAISTGKAVQEAATSLGSKQKAEAIFKFTYNNYENEEHE